MDLLQISQGESGSSSMVDPHISQHGNQEIALLFFWPLIQKKIQRIFVLSLLFFHAGDVISMNTYN